MFPESAAPRQVRCSDCLGKDHCRPLPQQLSIIASGPELSLKPIDLLEVAEADRLSCAAKLRLILLGVVPVAILDQVRKQPEQKTLLGPGDLHGRAALRIDQGERRAILRWAIGDDGIAALPEGRPVVTRDSSVVASAKRSATEAEDIARMLACRQCDQAARQG